MKNVTESNKFRSVDLTKLGSTNDDLTRQEPYQWPGLAPTAKQTLAEGYGFTTQSSASDG